MNTGTDLTEGPIGRHMVRLTVPMIGTLIALFAFALTDTGFVSRLGTQALAAISFVFPVVMVMGSITLGLGLGASSCIARALGKSR
jgi:Na+-driven multidrug efflux pump